MHAYYFIKRNLLACALFISTLSFTQAQSINDLQRTQQAKLESAIQQLTKQRQQIQADQIPLSKELRNLEVEVKKLRKELEEKRKARDSRSVDLDTLKQSINSQQQALNYITRTLFGEYNATYESALSTGELSNYGKSIRELNLQLENPTLTQTEQLKSMLDLVTESTERIDSTIGGKTYPGKALNEAGRLIEGQFLQIGPLLYFSGEENSGVIEENETLQARIQTIDLQADELIKATVQNGTGELPIDSSLGNALAMKSTQDSLLVHMKKGGIWVYPIILFAFIATVVALFKFIQIIKIRQPNSNVVHDIVKLLRDNKQKDALAIARNQPEPARNMLVQAVEHADESIELVEEAMYESMLNTQPALERYLNVIAVTASVAPLLGLLGTVTGIIKTFNLMKVFGAGDPKPLISGISEALITTELGLILAIPALIIHALLSRKVAGVMTHIEKLSVAFINGLARHGHAK